jgi:hypothetical protein
MDEQIRNLVAQHISVNIPSFGAMVPKSIPKTTTLDFKENYKTIMRSFSIIYTVIESSVPNMDESAIELSSAISASISHLFGEGSSDLNSIGNLNSDTYNQQILLPVHSQYKVFYDYVTLVLKASREHNRRLGIQ